MKPILNYAGLVLFVLLVLVGSGCGKEKPVANFPKEDHAIYVDRSVYVIPRSVDPWIYEAHSIYPSYLPPAYQFRLIDAGDNYPILTIYDREAKKGEDPEMSLITKKKDKRMSIDCEGFKKFDVLIQYRDGSSKHFWDICDPKTKVTRSKLRKGGKYNVQDQRSRQRILSPSASCSAERDPASGSRDTKGCPAGQTEGSESTRRKGFYQTSY
jgi:hypothetical protein